MGKRTMDFKVTYLDSGLTSAYFSECEAPSSNGNGGGGGGPGSGAGSTTGSGSSTKVPKRYKAHLRDFLSSCRTKRSKHHHSSSVSATDIYASVDPAAAAAASALPYATVYSTPPSATHAYGADSPLYMQQNIASSPYQAIYPVDNR
jgi:aryl hydrocarbon receptor